ncbi:MAG: DUF4190 domain-containing protein [Ignavibacteriae bacterium]|nr:DUF4190 domain-containing protein [Ignavibacteriota bacterium]MCB0723360.1 DUF4190 domain-containing protein [Ignavibacteriota bacterium]MCB9243206.1 DUF4190 domain-containing protein [Ignavibacteriales bacterium]
MKNITRFYRQDSGPGAPPPPPPPPSDFSAPPPPPPPSGGSTGSSGESASTNAIIALVLGIAAYVCLGIFAAIPAWIVGKKEIKAIEEGRSPQAGLTMAKIGMWLGIVNVILSVLFLLVYLLIIVASLLSN